MKSDRVFYRCSCAIDIIPKSQLRKHLLKTSKHNIEKSYIVKADSTETKNILKRMQTIQSSENRVIQKSSNLNLKINKKLLNVCNFIDLIKTIEQNADQITLQRSYQSKNKDSKKISLLRELEGFYKAYQVVEVTKYKELKERISLNTKQFFKRHMTSINSFVLSKDGQLLLSAGREGYVRLWNANDLSQIHCFSCNISKVENVDIDNLSQFGLSNSNDLKVSLWDLKKLKLKALFELKDKTLIISLKFSNNSSYFLLGMMNGYVLVFSTFTCKMISTISLFFADCIAFFFNNNQNIAIYNTLGLLKIFKINNSTPNVEKTMKAGLSCFDYSNDSQILCSGHRDGYIQIVSLKNFSIIKSFKAHDKAVQSVSFCRFCKRYASAAGELVVKLWDAETFHLLAEIGEFDAEIRCVIIRNFTLYITGATDQINRLEINSEKSTKLKRFNALCLAYSLKLNLICYGYKEISLYSLASNSDICSRSFSCEITCLAFAGSVILGGTVLGRVLIVDPNHLRVKKSFLFTRKTLRFLSASEGLKILAFSTQNKATLIDLRTSEKVLNHPFCISDGKFNSTDFVFIDTKLRIFIFSINSRVLRTVGVHMIIQFLGFGSSGLILTKNLLSEVVLFDLSVYPSGNPMSFNFIKKSSNSQMKQKIKMKKQTLILSSLKIYFKIG